MAITPSPFIYERLIRFDDVDAAALVFFGRFFSYCHEAMEDLFDALPGGYVSLITKRRVGLPTVHVDAEYKSPLRFGDKIRILVDVLHLGVSSAKLRYRIERLPDGVFVAQIQHIFAAIDLDAHKSIPLPDDVRRTLESHAAAEAP